ncbi:ABC transporter permease [Acetonema longum]|uniref:Binding-protein-dependent transport systems inner membrane component n=1 Tax=Acetonema longum DSM 6540 TaxID=1009370 RepID=F7NI25_9FIRM|nr:ABC transporter permease [Acetonema longum]EGO64332.1 binding-protein-dependent transport systems inner membrane component [Acetonema longum DSM 6540]
MEKETFRREVKYRLAFLERALPYWASYISVIILLIIWELLVRMGVIAGLYLPAPSSIMAAAAQMIASGELLTNLQASLIRIAAGFFIGSAAGILTGLLTGISRLAEVTGNPVIYSLYPVPKIALLPLFVLWLGIGELPKITMISLGVFFPVVINTYSGVKNLDPLLIKAAVTFGAGRVSLMTKVILPGSLPVIFAGLKLAAGTSLLLLAAAEMIAAQEGIGAMILHYGDLMLTTKLMVGVVTLSLLGVVFNHLLGWVERRMIPWKQ